MEQNALFRKSALDKLASPERLDMLMQVTSPKGWVALTAIGVVLVIGVYWSVTGSIPETVGGQGLVIGKGGRQEIKASGAGILRELKLTQGAVVKQGDIIGEVEVAAEVGNPINLSAQRAQIHSDYENAAEQAQSRRDQANVTIATLKGSLTRAQANRDDAAGILARKKQAPPGAYSENEIKADEGRLRGFEDALADISNQTSAQQTVVNNAAGAIRAAAVTRDSRLAGLRADIVIVERSKQIISEFNGKVTEILRKSGDPVQQNQAVAVIAPMEGEDSRLRVLLLVPAVDGRRIKAGMSARVDLQSTYRREVYGLLIGTIASVGGAAVRSEELSALLANEAEVRRWMDGSSKILVWADLTPADTPSGFEWSSGRGPDGSIESNTEIIATVEVASVTPISRVIPYFKKTLGVS